MFPIALTDFDYRYLLPVLPFACLAAGLAFAPARAPARAPAPAPPDDSSSHPVEVVAQVPVSDP